MDAIETRANLVGSAMVAVLLVSEITHLHWLYFHGMALGGALVADTSRRKKDGTVGVILGLFLTTISICQIVFKS